MNLKKDWVYDRKIVTRLSYYSNLSITAFQKGFLVAQGGGGMAAMGD